MFITGEVESGDYFDFVLPYCKATQRWNKNVSSGTRKPYTQMLTMWYEEMIKAPDSCVAALADFLSFQLSSEQVTTISNACSFESMKSSDLQFGTHLSKKLLYSDSKESGSVDKACLSHVRKGGVGGWKEYLTVEESAQIDCKLAAKSLEYEVDIDFNWG